MKKRDKELREMLREKFDSYLKEDAAASLPPAAESVPVPAEGSSFDCCALSVMDSAAFNPAHREMTSHRRKPISSIILFFKKAVRRCLMFYVNPITDQQTVFNQATVQAVRSSSMVEADMQSAIRLHSDSLASLGRRIDSLTSSTADSLSGHGSELESVNEKLRFLHDDLLDDRSEYRAYQSAAQENLSFLNKTMKDNAERMDADKAAVREEFDRMRGDSEALVRSLMEEKEQLYARIGQMQQDMESAKEEMESAKAEMRGTLNCLQQELSQYMSVIEETRRNNDTLRSLGIGKADSDIFRSYSQSGEDTITGYVLRSLGIAPGEVTYLDLGANHAKTISNTYSFYEAGGHGVLVEANPELIPELRLYRSNDVILNMCVVADENIQSIPFHLMNGDGLSSPDEASIANALSENPVLKVEKTVNVPAITAKKLIEMYMPKAPTVLNVDIEGMETEVLDTLDLDSWRPLVLIVETIPYHPYLVHDEKRTDIAEFLKTKDYTEYAFTGINSVFVDLKKLHGWVK